MSQLILTVKQGEELNFPITVKEAGSPKDLTTATIRVQVKKTPYEATVPMFEKVITATSDPLTQGQITDPMLGELFVRFLVADTSYPPNDYSLVIFLEQNNEKDIISGNACSNGVYKICTQ